MQACMHGIVAITTKVRIIANEILQDFIVTVLAIVEIMEALN